nr:immunoglobulin heavy chain junction region [Macaca mulatta]MOX59959.1 immunoglobulin heavy chain junction region [Macaca mulatta]MOX61535.1 immunoglobulin heavy chain junction region [Macaca mulatta]MOX65211.1 immunoglobulin heavy chain junction region [Macaca mulatta]MOX65228.1 immunoglobulin heavy chain junction region [Macaca mulatta]
CSSDYYSGSYYYWGYGLDSW